MSKTLDLHKHLKDEDKRPPQSQLFGGIFKNLDTTDIRLTDQA